MTILLGRESLPQFRLQQLGAELAQLGHEHDGLTAHELFLLHAPEPLGDDHLSRLYALLSAGPLPCSSLSPEQLIVAPRPGTQTPWASKAQDILARCGLPEIQIEQATLFHLGGLAAATLPAAALEVLHDRMAQVVVTGLDAFQNWFEPQPPAPLRTLSLGEDPMAALRNYSQQHGLALAEDEIEWLADAYARLGRDPSDAELMMFAQANSEHCRHKIFNARWTLDGQPLEDSLFGLIRKTHAATPEGTLVAYDDNAAVMEGFELSLGITTPDEPSYRLQPVRGDVQIKVETHNHPTAIAPGPGAATGAGGEIRDEAATGRGARSIASLCGFSVSDLRIPDWIQPWETTPEPPSNLSTPLQIMLRGPQGAAGFNNEFGRPSLLGYFRSFSAQIHDRLWGYHKPIMIAGGSGLIIEGQTHKKSLQAGDRIMVLGGPAMLIGLGGGAASSATEGHAEGGLDFSSVQRGNPEMQRRAQEVIDRCWMQGENNPIKSIHDVGAGGLSNALPELLHDGGVGGQLELREIPTADPALSPMELWCNEAQERYVLAVAAEDLDRFVEICRRERCPYADLGAATDDGKLLLSDRLGSRPAVDLPLQVLLGKLPRMERNAVSETLKLEDQGLDGMALDEAINRVLALPAVGSKHFLITGADRTAGGLTARDQLVGPHQLPVADCAITLLDYHGYAGTAMSMGERTPLAVHDPAAASRMAIAEALTNLAGVVVRQLSHVKLSANWMAAAGTPGQDAALRMAVEAASEFSRQLSLAIPVGKDSLSMQTVWSEAQGEQRMVAPVSLIVSAFAPVPDVRRHRVPMLHPDPTSHLLLLDLGRGRLGASALAQVYARQLGAVPDVDDVQAFRQAFVVIQELVAAGHILACHDRSDGGLLVSVLEMALAGRTGVELDLEAFEGELLRTLFNEELGLVLQVSADALESVRAAFAEAGLADRLRKLGRIAEHRDLVIQHGGQRHVRALPELAARWSETSHRIQRLRDYPEGADEEYAALVDWDRPGLGVELGFEPPAPVQISLKDRPRVAVLREQGSNGQREMAQAFMQAGFEAVDVHMSDLEAGRQRLDDFQTLALVGGFSFGDVLGAGQGWARSILFNPGLREQFERYFQHPHRLTLGVCNGGQMLSGLREIIPGSEAWPRLLANRSRRFEARLAQVKIEEGPSPFFVGMAGSRLPVVAAHGQGRAAFEPGQQEQARVMLRYVDGYGQATQHYPDNPSGTPGGIAGLTTTSGRVTMLMPHPERLLRTVNFSWAPPEWGEYSPWMKMFHNARQWLEQYAKA